jgi:hypothetical protein
MFCLVTLGSPMVKNLWLLYFVFLHVHVPPRFLMLSSFPSCVGTMPRESH